MANYSKYPNSIDSTTELPISTNLVTPVSAEVVNRLRSAIIAIEQELGVNPSGEYSTVKSRLDAIVAGSGGGNGSIQILSDGTIIVSSATVIDFVGNVNVTNPSPLKAQVEIIGGQAEQVQELKTVNTNGQTSFTLTDTPIESDGVQMYVNGLKQSYGTEYSVSGNTVTYLGSISLLTTDKVEFYYLIDLGGVSSGVTGPMGPTGPIGPQGPAGSGGGGAGPTFATQATPGLIRLSGDLAGISSTASAPTINRLSGDASGSVQIPSGVNFYLYSNASAAATGLIRLPNNPNSNYFSVIRALGHTGSYNLLAYGYDTSGAQDEIKVGDNLKNSGNELLSLSAQNKINFEVNSPSTVASGLNIAAAKALTIYRDTVNNAPVLGIYGPSGATGLMTFQLQSGGASYALKWPNAVGSSGNVLSTDAVGNLSWIASSGGSIPNAKIKAYVTSNLLFTDAAPTSNIITWGSTSSLITSTNCSKIATNTEIQVSLAGTYLIQGQLQIQANVVVPELAYVNVVKNDATTLESNGLSTSGILSTDGTFITLQFSFITELLVNDRVEVQLLFANTGPEITVYGGEEKSWFSVMAIGA